MRTFLSVLLYHDLALSVNAESLSNIVGTQDFMSDGVGEPTENGPRGLIRVEAESGDEPPLYGVSRVS